MQLTEWKQLPRSIRAYEMGYELNVWQVGGEGFRFTASRCNDGVYIAARSHYPTQEAAKEGALRAIGYGRRDMGYIAL